MVPTDAVLEKILIDFGHKSRVPYITVRADEWHKLNAETANKIEQWRLQKNADEKLKRVE